MELSEVADELYGVPPEEFVAARTAARDRARADGDRELATAIAALPKPSTAAWVCNLLVRRQPEEITQLVDLGGLLRQAQATLSGPQLKELGRQRSQVVAALTRQARALAHAEGHDVSTAIAEQVEETLRAAVADPDAGQALIGGRLTGALSYTGLGPVDLRGAVAVPAGRRPAAAPRSGARRASGAAGQRRDREEQRRREEAERRRRELAQAREDAAEAARVAAETAAAAEDAERRLTGATQRRDDLRARVAELQEQLRRAERQAGQAATDVQEAEQRREAAVRRAGTAAAIADRAREHADRLAAAGEG